MGVCCIVFDIDGMSFEFFILMVFIDYKGFKVRKVQFTLVIYLGQYLRNGACCDQCLYEVHIRSHI